MTYKFKDSQSLEDKTLWFHLDVGGGGELQQMKKEQMRNVSSKLFQKSDSSLWTVKQPAPFSHVHRIRP